MTTRFYSIITYLKNKPKLYMVSFGIPFLTMLILFGINGIFPFGDRSFLNIDMYHQYFPFLTDFFHKLLKLGMEAVYSNDAHLINMLSMNMTADDLLIVYYE